MVRVLVVDDDLSIREVLRMMLEYIGYDVTDATDGGEALAILRSSPEPCIVLLDLRMPPPGPDGMEVLQIVLAEPYLTTHHGYILITASRDLQALRQEGVVQALGVPVLDKPFEMAFLLDTVDTVARHLQERDLPLSPTGSEYCVR